MANDLAGADGNAQRPVGTRGGRSLRPRQRPQQALHGARCRNGGFRDDVHLGLLGIMVSHEMRLITDIG
ncbi:MAG: hypothetical protein ACK55I_42140 [bacterium]